MPAVPEGVLGVIRQIPVPLKHHGPFNRYFTDITGIYGVVLVINQPHIGQLEGPAGGARPVIISTQRRHGGCFRLAVNTIKGATGQFLIPFDRFRIFQPFDGLQRGDVPAGFFVRIKDRG